MRNGGLLRMRFTYAAFCVVDGSSEPRNGAAGHGTNRLSPRPFVILLALLTIAAAWTFLMPYAVAREALANGAPVAVMAGPRDRSFFVDGWSGLGVTGNVSRSATEPTASL